MSAASLPQDVDTCAATLEDRGISVLSPPTDQPFEHRTLFFRDPDGNALTRNSCGNRSARSETGNRRIRLDGAHQWPLSSAPALQRRRSEADFVAKGQLPE
ncbi:VOC family protein [Bradyrhizobium oligotrophicum]|uniref:VOC family protein n=1 Tax=Bradyrhizobium oligotrophicum TaxID=44255 RepID=UPI000A0714C1